MITLSQAVAQELLSSGRVEEPKLRTLFLPDLSYVRAHSTRCLEGGLPIRLLFLGRLMKYKGLSLLLDALEIYKRDVPVTLGYSAKGTSTKNWHGCTCLVPRSSIDGLRQKNRRVYSADLMRSCCPILRRVNRGWPPRHLERAYRSLQRPSVGSSSK